MLHRTFTDLGYHYGDHSEHECVFAYEWFAKDVVAVQGVRSAWAGACWRGRYVNQIVCELENSIAEFEMTMRGLFDVRARLYVGIFFGGSDDPLVGEKLWNPKCADPTRPMSAWSPPSPGEEFPWSFAQGDEVLTIVLSDSRPSIRIAPVIPSATARGASSSFSSRRDASQTRLPNGECVARCSRGMNLTSGASPSTATKSEAPPDDVRTVLRSTRGAARSPPVNAPWLEARAQAWHNAQRGGRDLRFLGVNMRSPERVPVVGAVDSTASLKCPPCMHRSTGWRLRRI